jgi:hypothetical protein
MSGLGPHPSVSPAGNTPTEPPRIKPEVAVPVPPQATAKPLPKVKAPNATGSPAPETSKTAAAGKASGSAMSVQDSAGVPDSEIQAPAKPGLPGKSKGSTQRVQNEAGRARPKLGTVAEASQSGKLSSTRPKIKERRDRQLEFSPDKDTAEEEMRFAEWVRSASTKTLRQRLREIELDSRSSSSPVRDLSQDVLRIELQERDLVNLSNWASKATADEIAKLAAHKSATDKTTDQGSAAMAAMEAAVLRQAFERAEARETQPTGLVVDDGPSPRLLTEHIFDSRVAAKLLNDLQNPRTSDAAFYSLSQMSEGPLRRLMCREDGSLASVSGRTFYRFQGSPSLERQLPHTEDRLGPPDPNAVPTIPYQITKDGSIKLTSWKSHDRVDGWMDPETYARYLFLRDSDVFAGESIGAITTGVMLKLGVNYDLAVTVGRSLGGIISAHYRGDTTRSDPVNVRPLRALIERVAPSEPNTTPRLPPRPGTRPMPAEATPSLGAETSGRRNRAETPPPSESKVGSVRLPDEAAHAEAPSARKRESGAAGSVDGPRLRDEKPAAAPLELWERLLTKAEIPQARQTIGGFRSQSVREGRFEVVIVEGPVAEQIRQTDSVARASSSVLKGEHRIHAIGLLHGENLPEGITSGPARLNLSPLKTLENYIYSVDAKIAQAGGRVETKTVLLIEHRMVAGEDIKVLQGVRRSAWIVLPGSDKTWDFADFAAIIDPSTRSWASAE